MFKAQNCDDASALEAKVNIVTLHEVYDCIGSFRQEGPIQSKQLAMSHCTTQDAPENVTASLVAWKDSIGGEEDQRAGVVGNHPQRGIGFRILPIRGAGKRGEAVDDHTKRIGIEDRLFALQDHRETFQAQAGVDVLLRQRRTRAIEVLVELHKDQVPDLQEALAIAAGRAIRFPTAMLDASIIVNLGIRAAWARGSRWPPPVILQAHNRFVRNAGT